MKKVKVKRVLIIEGTDSWVETTLSLALVSPNHPYKVPYGSVMEIERTIITDAEKDVPEEV